MWGVTLAKESSEGEKDWNNGSREHRRECMRTLEAGDVDGETDRGSSSFQTTRYRRREYDRLRTERLTRARDDHSIVSLATGTDSSSSSFPHLTSRLSDEELDRGPGEWSVRRKSLVRETERYKNEEDCSNPISSPPILSRNDGGFNKSDELQS
jgi:hypothetical protein